MAKKSMDNFFLGALILLAQLHQSSSQRNIDPELQAKIDNFIQKEFLPKAQINGLGLTIVKDDGQLLYTTGYGMANIEKGIPNQNSTQFLIGSVSKGFTALLTIKLLHEKFPDMGEGVLDTPIRKLMPEVNFTLIDRFRSEHATFRDLLAHRLCLFNDDLQLLADPFNQTEEITFGTRYTFEVCGVRTKMEYNNQMYVLAGELAGILAGKPYEDAMQDLLNELGMTNTAFVQKTDDFSQMPFRAMPYYVKDNVAYEGSTELAKRIKLSNDAGGLFAPANDMAKYLRFHLNLGTIDGKKIVPREVVEWMTKPSIVSPGYTFRQSEDELGIINRLGYGLGLGLYDYDGWKYIRHTGNFPPYSSVLSLFPSEGLGVFTNVNMGPLMEDPMVIHSFIFEAIKGNSNPREKVMKVKESIERKKEGKRQEAKQELKAIYDKIAKVGGSGAKRQADLVGIYGSGSGGEVEVSERLNEETNSTQLYIKYGRWYSGWLQEVEGGNGVFFHIAYDSDIIQDDYAGGANDGSSYVVFDEDGTLLIYIVAPDGSESRLMGQFKLGLRSDDLPTIPWSPDSCEPEK